MAASEEERFNPNKQYGAFASRAVAYCLAEAGISIGEVDCIGFYERPVVKFWRIVEATLACWLGTY